MYEAALVLSVVVFVVTVAVYLRHPSASIFHPATFYLMFHGLVFVIRPIFAWHYGFRKIYDAMHFTPSLWDKTQTLICTNLALVVFMTVMLVLIQKPLQFRQDGVDLAERPVLLQIFWLVAIPLGLMGAYSVYWLWDYQQTGEMVSDLDMRTGWRAMQATNGYFYAAGGMLAPIVAMIAFLGRFKAWSLAPFAVYAIFRLGTGQRGDFVAAAVMMALLFLFDRRSKWPNLIVVAAALVLVPVFDSIQRDRGAGIREAFGSEIAERYQGADGEDEAPLETMDLSNMEMVEHLVWLIPERSGSYDYFLQNLQVFTEPIPRAWWKDKPVGAPIRLFDLYSHSVPINGVWSVPGMGWMYWGYPGVAIWSAFFAWIYGTGYKLFARSRQSNLTVIAYMIFLSTAIIAYRDGTILTILKQCLFYFVPVVGLLFLAKFSNLPSIEWQRSGSGVDRSSLGAADGAVVAQATARSSLEAAITPRERRRARAVEPATTRQRLHRLSALGPDTGPEGAV